MGSIGFKEQEITDLLMLYAVDDPVVHAQLLALTREANEASWWHTFGNVVDTWFQNYLDLEQAAELIRAYEIQFIPGLLQTESYAGAAIGLGRATAAHEVDLRVQLRLGRKNLLLRSDGPRLRAVLGHAALRRPIGGREVLREQIEALLDSCRLPNVRMQVNGFSILRFADEELPDVVYIERPTSGKVRARLRFLDDAVRAAAAR